VAATVEARRLTEAHRVAQARLGARTVAQMLAAFRLLDPDDLDGSYHSWLRVAVPLIQGQRALSSRLAGNYLATFRTLELGAEAAAFSAVLAGPAPVEQIATSLAVTGPVSVRRNLVRGLTVEQAMDMARLTTARSGMRLALAGGRETITATTAADRQALGWARATSGNPCHFCAALASRGPVYSQSGVDFEAHDGCSCIAEPVYRRDAAWPSGSERFREVWDESTAGLSGNDALNAFRHAIEA
jgi:hypothetical protein